jgi:stage II sporulation protein D
MRPRRALILLTALLTAGPLLAEDEPVAPPSFTAPPVVRIWISDLPEATMLSCDGPCRLSAGTSARLMPLLVPSEIRSGPRGLLLDGDPVAGPALELSPAGKAPLSVNGRSYVGTLRITSSNDGIIVVNDIDLENYLEGVLGAEMPPAWPAEALKAQAVAARTYALYSALSRAGREWDLKSTVEDQVYSGAGAKPAVIAAVRATRGEVLLHDGKLFPAFFHSTCGGETQSPGRALGQPAFDFLRGVPCPYCAASPHYRWRCAIPAAQLGERLAAAGYDIGVVRDIILTEAEPDGPLQALVAGERGFKLLSMVDFRRAVGRMDVRGGRFECAREGDEFIFTGRGLGHGAGMCQWGAKGMADRGATYRDILGHYYMATGVEKLY